MNVTLCDVCKKKIEFKDEIVVRVGWKGQFAFCLKCGKFALDFLKKRGILKETP